MTTNNIVNAPFPLASTFIASTAGFDAKLTADATNATGDGTGFVVAAMTEITDTTSNFDPLTGTFVAPLDGMYLFEAAIDINNLGVAHTDASAFFKINATIYIQEQCNPFVCMGAGGDLILCYSKVVQI